MLEAFEYTSGIAGKFRQVYVRWERWKIREAYDAMGGWEMTLKQELNKIMEIVEQIDALSPRSRRYLMELIAATKDPMPEKAFAQKRGGKAAQPRDAEPIDEAGDTEDAKGQAPVHPNRPCGCAWKGMHLKTCPDRQAAMMR